MTVQQKGGLSIRMYDDSRPHKCKSAAIHKGLILVYDGEEICGEGIGFGAPVVKYKEKTYFPKDATLSVSERDGIASIVKVFEINSVFRIKLLGRYITSPLFYSFTEFFSRIHRERVRIRKLLDLFLALLRKRMGRPADLVTASYKGRIAVRYQIYEGEVLINVDSSELSKIDCEEICIMNEQGADFFRKYTDSAGSMLVDDEISSWDKVEAGSACFSDVQERVSFELSNLPGVDLYRGRECFDGHLAWSGFAYSVPPELDTFEYSIKLKGRKDG